MVSPRPQQAAQGNRLTGMNAKKVIALWGNDNKGKKMAGEQGFEP